MCVLKLLLFFFVCTTHCTALDIVVQCCTTDEHKKMKTYE